MDLAAVDALVAALRERSPSTTEQLLSWVVDGVAVFGPFGVGEGRAAVEALVDHPTIARLTGHATWTAPERDGDVVSLTALSPPQAAVGGLDIALHLDRDGRITRIEQDLLPAASLDPEPLALTEEHAELLIGALANGTPMIVAYVDAAGRPHLSYRATVQVLGPDRLGMWIRDRNGGLLRALATNPELSCFYSDRVKGVTLQFFGRGRVDDDAAVRDQVYDASPELERTMDWRKQGVAVVIDVDRVEGRDGTGRVLMAAGD